MPEVTTSSRGRGLRGKARDAALRGGLAEGDVLPLDPVLHWQERAAGQERLAMPRCGRGLNDGNAVAQIGKNNVNFLLVCTASGPAHRSPMPGPRMEHDTQNRGNGRQSRLPVPGHAGMGRVGARSRGSARRRGRRAGGVPGAEGAHLLGF